MNHLTKRDAQRAVTTVKTQATTLGGLLGTMWASLGANAIVGGALFQYGVVPRSIIGLRGILFAPFIHGSFAHLAANTVSFALLGWLVMLTGRGRFWRVMLAAMLGAGLLPWLIGAPGSVHIGASGVIFGFLGYLMANGVFTRNVWSILLSLGVTAAWGGLVFGVLPGQPGISWQAHLGGFVAGLFAARSLGRRSR
jgi:membrane associated rhomboid family serine protease